MTRALLAAAAAAATAGVALAETPVARTLPLTGNTVSIEMITGRLTVEGSGGREVEIKGVLRHRCEELQVDSDAEGVSIEVEWTCHGSTKGYGDETADLTVRVPRGADLEVETISAPVTISGVEGSIDVETISGTLDVRGGSKSVDLASVSGRLGFVCAAPVEHVGLETVSGSIEADIDPAARGTVEIESVSGSIVLTIAAGASASFDVSSFSGSIRNELGPGARKTSPYLPSQELSFSLGGGDARISIETLSGRIEIRGR